MAHPVLVGIVASLVGLSLVRAPGLEALSPLRQDDIAADRREFPHRVHLEDAGLDCENCHPRDEPTGAYGRTSLGICKLCHEGLDEDKPASERVDRFYDEAGQPRGPFFARSSEEVLFSHGPHVESSDDCAACHGDMSASESIGAEVAVGMATCVSCHEQKDASTDCATCHQEVGSRLYERQCVICHGERGGGDGPVAYLLSPAPRDFTKARFRLVSTANAVPSDEDLIAVMKLGMPGSAMPPFEWMSDDELSLLAAHVRGLSVEGQILELQAWAADVDEELSTEEARAIAVEKLTPGETLEPGDAPSDPLTLDRGRRIYEGSCASCHGDDGRGQGVQEQWNEDGSPTRPRDMTAGIFKGGTSAADIIRRIRLGMPGSPMPAAVTLSEEERSAVAAYVRSLIPPAAEERVVASRKVIRAQRVAGGVPSDPEDPRWKAAPGEYLALMPVAWRDRRIEGVIVRSLWDAERLAVHVSWEDASRDVEPSGQTTTLDAAALQLTRENRPPVFAMSDSGFLVEVALWKAAGEEDPESSREVPDRRPSAPPPAAEGAPGDEPSIRHRFSSGAEAAGASEPHPSGSDWTARGQWTAGIWEVVFEGPRPENDRVSIAFAVWDGSAGDRGGRKFFTVWQLLRLEP